MNIGSLVNQARQSFSKFWAVRDPRERLMLTSAAAVIALSLIYAVLIAPALSGRAQMVKNLPALRQQVAQLQALSKDASALPRRSTPPMAAMSKESLESALNRKNLKPQSVTFNGDLIKVQLSSVSFANTLSWVDEMQKTAALSVVDANIVGLAQVGVVDVTLTLRQQRNE